MGRIVYRVLDEGRGILHEVYGFVPGAFFADTWAEFLARHAERVVDLTAEMFHERQVVGTHAPGDVEFGMTRMWQLRSPYSDPVWQVAVLRDRAEMMTWIGEHIGRPVPAVPGEVLLEAHHPG